MTNTKHTARPARIDPSTLVDFGDAANVRHGEPSTFVRNDDGSIELVTDDQLTADLEAELDAQHEAELADQADAEAKAKAKAK